MKLAHLGVHLSLTPVETCPCPVCAETGWRHAAWPHVLAALSHPPRYSPLQCGISRIAAWNPPPAPTHDIHWAARSVRELSPSHPVLECFSWSSSRAPPLPLLTSPPVALHAVVAGVVVGSSVWGVWLRRLLLSPRVRHTPSALVYVLVVSQQGDGGSDEARGDYNPYGSFVDIE